MNSNLRDKLHEPGATGLFRNSVFVALGQGSVALLFTIYILAARLLGDAAYGEFMLGLTIATILSMLPAWGSNRYSSIMAARDPDRTREIIATRLGLTIPLAILYFPLVWLTATLWTENPTVVAVALLLGGDLMVRDYGNFLRRLFRVHDAYGLETVTAFAERACMVLGAVVVLLVRPEPALLALGFIAGRSFGAGLTTVIFIRRVCPIGIHFDRQKLLHLFTAGSPLALRKGIASLSFRVDMLFLGRMRTEEEVGWYGAIYNMMEGVIMLPDVVKGSFGPSLSANFGEGRAHVVNRLYQRGLKYLLVGSLLLGAVFAVLAEPIISIVYGSEYIAAVDALRIVALAVVFIFVRRFATEVLDNVDLRAATVWIFAVGLMVNIALNVLLIPRYGISGAAAATVATEAYLMFTMLWILRREGYTSRIVRQIREPVLALVFPVGLMWWMIGTPILAGMVGTVVYGVALTLLGAWDEKDRALFRNVAAYGRRRLRAIVNR